MPKDYYLLFCMDMKLGRLPQDKYRVSEYRVLRRIFGFKRVVVTLN
jgi:hypothetical protein